MDLIIKLSNYFVPFFLLLIMCTGIKERRNVFDLFIEGANDGIRTVIDLLPTLIGILFSVEILNCSGIIELIITFFKPILKFIDFPPEIIPLAIVRPISGSAATAVATELMKKYGVDSYIGLVASVIMGSTETTLYTIAIYTGGLNVKKSNSLLIAALTADAVGILAAVVFCKILSMSFS